MECGICQRQFNARRSAVCASCVQATLHRPRLDQVEALLSREKSYAHVEAVVRPGNDGILAALPEDADWDAITAGISVRSHERAKAEREAIELRMEPMSEVMDGLRSQIEEHKRYIAAQKQDLERRKNRLAVEKRNFEPSKVPAREPLQAAIKKANRHLEKVHTRMSDGREHLCRELGLLCGLRRTKDKKGRCEYYLNRLIIPNLKDLNCINGRIHGEKLEKSGQALAEPHEVISASLDNVCLFLAICCFYLSVRLPAEVILPHHDFPHAVLMQRDVSYKAGELRYPGLGSTYSSPAQSRVLPTADERGKARLLQLEKPLVQLHKEDHKTRALFLEGVMLLAYDIAWLCRTQGVVEGTPSFDDICDIGQNLYALAGKDSHQTRPPLSRQTTAAPSKSASAPVSNAQFGRFSHASASHDLGGHEGLAMFAPDAFRISVTTITDRLKAYLRNEVNKSEWDVIDANEWDELLEHEEPVMVGGKRPVDAKGPAMSVMTVVPHDGPEDSDAKASAGKGKGNSGWMKVRGRSGTGDAA